MRLVREVPFSTVTTLNSTCVALPPGAPRVERGETRLQTSRDTFRRPNARAGRDRRQGGVELFHGESGGRLVAADQRVALRRRDHVVDIVKHPAAALVEKVEQREGTRAAITEHDGRHRGAQPRIVGLERFRLSTVLEHRRAEHPGVNDRRLAPLEPVGYITCAASPSSATRRETQEGTGSRSITGYSKTSCAPRSMPGMSSQS